MSSPEPPLNPETLDELLSADIDGEFERAAADLGFTVDEARAAMDATADTARRRAQLHTARDRLATPIVLPPAVEQTLVSAALRGPLDELRAVRDRRTRSWRTVVAAGSAAAVIAGVVVVFAATSHHGGVSKSASAVSRAAPPNLARVAAPLVSQTAIEFGDVSRPATLRADVELHLREAEPNPAQSSAAAGPAPADGVAHVGAGFGVAGATGTQGLVGLPGPQGPQGLAGPPGLAGGSGLAGPQGLQGDEGIQGPIGPTGPTGAQGVTGPVGAAVTGAQGGTGAPGLSSARVPTLANAPSDQAGGVSFAGNSTVGAGREPVCVAAIERAAHLPSAPVLSGLGTYARRPAVIGVFARGDGYVAYVLAAADCAVVAQQTLP